jgi:ubiquinone/menaquinone biosynthesis C-methylase UbiE
MSLRRFLVKPRHAVEPLPAARPAQQTAGDVRDLFDRKAGAWTRAYEPGGKLADRTTVFLEWLTRLRPPPARFLDFGCGTGHAAKAFADRGYSAHGCDISSAMLAEGKRLFEGTIEFSPLSVGWTHLPYPDRLFDAALASSVLEYVDDPDFVLRELARVLRPGGILLVTVPNLRHPTRWLERAFAEGLRFGPVSALAERVPRINLYARFLRTSKSRFSEQRWIGHFTRAGFRTREVGLGASPMLQLFALERSSV